LQMRTGTGYSSGLTGALGYQTRVAFFGTSITAAQIWGFANNDATTTNRTANFVVEFARDGRFAHFGFQHIEKFGSWDGGAVVWGFNWDSGDPISEQPWRTQHRLLLDSNHTDSNDSQNMATLRIRNFLNQPAGSDFAAFTNSTGSLDDDADGDAVAKVEGYTRHGPWPHMLLPHQANPANAAVLLCPIQVKMHGSTGNSTIRHLIGRMRDIRVINIGQIQPKEIITVGSDDWQFFPWAQKLTNPSVGGTMASRNGGVAYKIDP